MLNGHRLDSLARNSVAYGVGMLRGAKHTNIAKPVKFIHGGGRKNKTEQVHMMRKLPFVSLLSQYNRLGFVYVWGGGN